MTQLVNLSYVEIPEGWENFSCIISSAEFFLDLLQEAGVRGTSIPPPPPLGICSHLLTGNIGSV